MDNTSQNPENAYQSRIPLTSISTMVDDIRAAIAKIIVGQHHIVELLLSAMLAEGHVLIEGVPGVAKTLMAKTMAKLIDAEFSRIQFTPDLMPSDVIGTNIFNPQTASFEFKQGPIFSNIVLIDEINRAPAKTQAALFEVMEERQITVDGTTYQLQSPFMVLATQNPIEHEGTYRLPEAQLDRFMFKLNVAYPSPEEELQILLEHHQQKGSLALEKLTAIMSKGNIDFCRNAVKQVHVEEKLLAFMAQIVVATRNNPNLYLGASPRATIALMKASKATAVLRGRDFVTPEDIAVNIPPVLRHRISATPEKEMEGMTTDDILRDIVAKYEIPR